MGAQQTTGNPVAMVVRGSAIAIACACLVGAGTGCDSSSGFDEKQIHREAKAMLVAVNDYYRGYLVLSPAGQKRLEGEVRACPAARHAPPKLRNLVRYTLPELFAAIDAQRFNADRFVRLARRIKTLHLQTPVLRRSATAYTAIAREAMKIPHVKIDHCDYLARWQAAGWGQKAQLQIHAQLYNDAGVDGRVVVSASRQARVPLSAQAKLGLPEPVEVLHLGSPAAEFFGFYVRAWKSTVAAEE